MELRKIIVGIDFSPAATDATHEAVELARHTGAELVLVHVGAVLDGTLGEAPEGALPHWEQVLQARLAEERNQLGALRQRLIGQGAEVSTTVVDAYPDNGLVQAAHDLDAELIVVGSHGHTGLRRFLLGSVAERVVRHAERCVLVSRPGGNVTGGYHRILLPTDFSDHADDALRMARVLAARGARIDVVHFWQLPPLASGYEGSLLNSGPALMPLREAVIADGERNLHTLLDRYRQPDLELHGELVEAAPAHGIAERARAEDRHYDVIILGSHGRRGVRRWILGSVAETTVRHAPCSVLVVHRRPEPRV
jgi:nucleotide-binding universal stress UspA family protein